MTTYAIQHRAMYDAAAMNCKSTHRSVKKSFIIATVPDFATALATAFVAGMITGFAWWCMV